MSNVASYYFLDNLPAAVLQFANSRSSEMVISDGSKTKTVLLGVAGTGETLGGELASSWTNNGFDTFDASSPPNITSAINTDSGDAKAIANGTVVTNGLLKYDYILNQTGAALVYLKTSLGTGLDNSTITTGNGAKSGYFTCTVANRVGFRIYTGNIDFNTTGLSFKMALTPSTSGIWFTPISEETGFNPNAASHTYTIYGRRRLVGNGGYWA